MNAEEMKQYVQQLQDLSRKYGNDPEYVLLGGGNTSWKNDEYLYVKASGHALGTIGPEGFVKMRLSALHAVWTTPHSEDKEKREEQVLQEMMDARAEGETARPSVEALLHSLIRSSFVVHLHPAMINGVTCGKNGQEAVHDMFGSRALWIPLVNPGYILAKTVKDALEEHEKQTDVYPRIIFLQNHGIFAGAESPEEIDSLYTDIMNTVSSRIQREPDQTPEVIASDREQKISQGLKRAKSADLSDYRCVGGAHKELLSFAKSREHAAPVLSSFTPDHIVYSGHKPLWIPEDYLLEGGKKAEERIAAAADAYIAEEKVPPKLVLVQNTGAFGAGKTVHQAESALILFYDTIKVAVYSESFGGPLFMTDDQIDFIRNWEVEKFRAKVHDES